jgi:hypothetical protein
MLLWGVILSANWSFRSHWEERNHETPPLSGMQGPISKTDSHFCNPLSRFEQVVKHWSDDAAQQCEKDGWQVANP